MKESNVVDKIFGLRHKFLIIGLTGRTGSGCSTVADILTTPREHFSRLKSEYVLHDNKFTDNQYRKNRIVYNYIRNNWQPFTVIKASDIIFYFALKLDFEQFKKALSHIGHPSLSKKSTDEPQPIQLPEDIELEYKSLHKRVIESEEVIARYTQSHAQAPEKEGMEDIRRLVLEDIKKFRDMLDEYLSKSNLHFSHELQTWGDNIRCYNSITVPADGKKDSEYPSCLAKKINQIIKVIRQINKINDVPTLIVIDALRNPFEILYFRERYSAYYTMSVNTSEDIRRNKLHLKGYDERYINAIDEGEKHKGDVGLSFERIDIDRCIEMSDIHIAHNGEDVSNNRPLINQIFTYISLIFHPGLVSPTPIERVMQIAYTAKLNSGCLSRQVGAVVTNQDYSVLSIGWNAVPQGQTPCALRNLDDLYNHEDDGAFSQYEKTDKSFKDYTSRLRLKYFPDNQDTADVPTVRGLTVSYCFKDIFTTINKPKQLGNQVHTRSLHAEENAFLQLAKYGCTGIKGGMLFTTASCCELCGKKAYQLGIKKIYYIDTYPGITERHIINCGDNRPEFELFRGAIGRAYIELYDQFMPLKDELEEVTKIKPKKLDAVADSDKPKNTQTNDVDSKKA